MIYLISIFLDSYFNYSLFTLLSLLLTYKRNKKNLFIISIILGLFYDIILNTLFINTILFILTFYLIEIIYNKKYIYFIINSLLIIIFYRIIQFIIVNINYSYSLYNLIKYIILSIPINILYVILVLIIKNIHKSKIKHIIK